MKTALSIKADRLRSHLASRFEPAPPQTESPQPEQQAPQPEPAPEPNPFVERCARAVTSAEAD